MYLLNVPTGLLFSPLIVKDLLIYMLFAQSNGEAEDYIIYFNLTKSFSLGASPFLNWSENSIYYFFALFPEVIRGSSLLNII